MERAPPWSPALWQKWSKVSNCLRSLEDKRDLSSPRDKQTGWKDNKKLAAIGCDATGVRQCLLEKLERLRFQTVLWYATLLRSHEIRGRASVPATRTLASLCLANPKAISISLTSLAFGAKMATHRRLSKPCWPNWPNWPNWPHTESLKLPLFGKSYDSFLRIL